MRRQVLFVGLICVAFLVNAQEEKTIDLDEVTIQASSIIRKKDRQLIFPSKDQVRRSMDGLDLTRRMSLPRLWVDPNTKSISMANGNVQLRIKWRVGFFLRSRRPLAGGYQTGGISR